MAPTPAACDEGDMPSSCGSCGSGPGTSLLSSFVETRLSSSSMLNIGRARNTSNACCCVTPTVACTEQQIMCGVMFSLLSVMEDVGEQSETRTSCQWRPCRPLIWVVRWVRAWSPQLVGLPHLMCSWPGNLFITVLTQQQRSPFHRQLSVLINTDRSDGGRGSNRAQTAPASNVTKDLAMRLRQH